MKLLFLPELVFQFLLSGFVGIGFSLRNFGQFEEEAEVLKEKMMNLI